jgi:hypothetical protein
MLQIENESNDDRFLIRKHEDQGSQVVKHLLSKQKDPEFNK